MKAAMRLAVVMTIILGVTPAISAGHAQGPVPIHEETAGLLSQATISPAIARLAAFGEFPGARLIDAKTGQVLCLEYTVDPDPRQHLAPTADPELVSLVKLSFATARDVADRTAKGVRVLGCKLRVEQSRAVYIFDLEIGAEHLLQQALIDANTGAVISTPPPR